MGPRLENSRWLQAGWTPGGWGPLRPPEGWRGDNVFFTFGGGGRAKRRGKMGWEEVFWGHVFSLVFFCSQFGPVDFLKAGEPCGRSEEEVGGQLAAFFSACPSFPAFGLNPRGPLCDAR